MQNDRRKTGNAQQFDWLFKHKVLSPWSALKRKIISFSTNALTPTPDEPMKPSLRHPLVTIFKWAPLWCLPRCALPWEKLPKKHLESYPVLLLQTSSVKPCLVQCLQNNPDNGRCATTYCRSRWLMSLCCLHVPPRPPVSKHPCISAGNFSCISPILGQCGFVAPSALSNLKFCSTTKPSQVMWWSK